jgi:hypothetical protein
MRRKEDRKEGSKGEKEGWTEEKGRKKRKEEEEIGSGRKMSVRVKTCW